MFIHSSKTFLHNAKHYIDCISFFSLVVGEALERLLMQRFIYEKQPSFPNQLQQFSVDSDGILTEEILSMSKIW